jgi:hypothetical protein
MYDFAGKSFCSRLRDLGCPDTLIKDVRDVAAAVCAARGRDGRKKFASIGNSGHLKLKPLNRLQGKTCEALFGNMRVLKGTLKKVLKVLLTN